MSTKLLKLEHVTDQKEKIEKYKVSLEEILTAAYVNKSIGLARRVLGRTKHRSH